MLSNALEHAASGSDDIPQDVDPSRNHIVRKIACCLIALAFTMLGTWMLNRYLFPIYDVYLITLRDITHLVTGFFFVFLAIMASRTSSPFASRHYPTLTIVISVAYALAMLGGVSLDSAPLIIVAAFLGPIGNGLATVMVCTAFLDMGLRTTGVVVALATLLAYTLRIPIELMPESAAVILAVALRVLTPLILLSDSREGFASIFQAGSVTDARLAKPSSFLPFGSHIFICMLVFQVVFGIALTYNEVARVPVSTGFELIPLSLVAVYICIRAQRHRDFNPDLLFRIAFLIILAGFLVIPISMDMPSGLANMLLYAGSDIFSIVSWYVIIAIALRNRLGAISTFSWGTAMKSIGVVVGAWIGRQLNTGSMLGVSREVIVAVVILLLASYVMYFVSHERFSVTIENITPVEKVVTAVPIDEQSVASVAAQTPSSEPQTDRFHERCEKIAARFDLTPREEDVLELLARGRNGHYIQEYLTVSYNTVKTHVFHVYSKVGVHTQQEIIDLVEDDGFPADIHMAS